MDGVNIRSEHILEQLGRLEAGFEMGRVLSAPKHRRYFIDPTPLDDTLEFRARLALHMAPDCIFPESGKLDKQKVRFGAIQFSPPVARGQLMQGGLRLKKIKCEVVHYARNGEFASGSRRSSRLSGDQQGSICRGHRPI